MKKLLFVLVILSSFGCYGGRHPKHTQECQLAFISPGGHIYWFMRPNKEVFAMNFDNPPVFGMGAQFKDITYYDDNADMVHFVKAQLK